MYFINFQSGPREQDCKTEYFLFILLKAEDLTHFTSCKERRFMRTKGGMEMKYLKYIRKSEHRGSDERQSSGYSYDD